MGCIMRERPAARILVLNSLDRLLLFQFAFEDGPLAGDKYWATPGGGVENDESFREAAQRELLEETGIDIDVGDEIGQRHAEFLLPSGEAVKADKRYFFVRVQHNCISEDGQQPLERKYMKRHRWWSTAKLKSTPDTVYPEELFDLPQKIPDG